MGALPPDDPPPGAPSGEDGPAGARAWARVHEYLHEALALDPPAREAFLASLALAEPALAADVRSLIRAHDASEQFLSEPPEFRPARTVAAGDRLGPYRILGEIAHGGMGVVYRARRDDESFTKDVAIKLVDPALRSAPVMQRFRDERQILALLEHPHIARLLDGGTAPDGAPYLVMEYVEGRSLLDYCDANRLGVDERLALFVAVCDAVQFAHQRLVVHRDLKSDNILVTREGSPRLLDFGIAKLLAADSVADAATLTAPMNRPLTPEYASPEQIRGEPAAVAGDIYSLGVVLYELLAGSRPLVFDTRTPEAILRVVLFEEPAPPSAAAARRSPGDVAALRSTTPAALRRRLAGDLDFIVLKSLEKDPARRYATVEQLAADVRRHQSGVPVLARGQSALYRASRFVRRHRVAVVAAALVTLVLVAGLAGTTWQASVARLERDRANRRFDDVRALAHAVVFDLHDAIANLPGSTRARATLVTHALRYLDRLRDDSRDDAVLQHEIGVAYAKIADVQGRPMFPNLGQSAAALENYDQALALIDRAARARPDSAAFARDLLVVSMRKSDLLAALGREAEALRLMLAAKSRLRLEMAAHPADSVLARDFGVACERLFDMKLAAGDTAGAVAEIREGLGVSRSQLATDPRDAVSRRAKLITFAKLGALFAAQGRRDSALAAYLSAERLALEAVAALPRDTEASRDLSIVYGMRGLFLAEAGALDSALAVYGRGMRISEELAASDPDNALQQADVAQGHFEIGGMLFDGARFREAEREFGDACARFTRLADADTANASHRLWAARSYRRAGDACEALARGARDPAERARWRRAAADGFARSLDRYRALERRGPLPAEDAGAPRALLDRLAALR